MADKLKNIAKEEVLQLRDLVNYQEGQVISKTLVQQEAVTVTLFAFDVDEEISTHTSTGDAMVTVLDGVGRFTVGENQYLVTKGETLVMPATVPHSVYAFESFKMLLTVIF